jgi:hypothetical protein
MPAEIAGRPRRALAATIVVEKATGYSGTIQRMA